VENKFEHKKIEQQILDRWKNGGYFKAKIDSSKKPYTIVLPPPNASGKMHTGNVLMIAIEDLLIRWKRMTGYSTLWLPGTDHAGFETQTTFERELKKEGKSRFDYDRNTLYKMIWDFVQKNKNMIEEQIKGMGASVDWSRYTFTLDEHVLKMVYSTFEKMFNEGLVYRDSYMVNYCPKCGTTFADLEIEHKERKDSLYYVRYPLLDRKDKEPEYLVVATTRPEPIMLDTHLAVNPKDKSKAKWIGRKLSNPLTGATMEIIGDSFVDKSFGTGIVKLTPAHDKTDYEVAKKLGLPIIQGIGLDGKMNENAGEYAGKSVFTARKEVVAALEEKGLIEKIDTEYEHAVSVCYRSGHDIEPMILPNWFIKVATLKKPAHDVVKSGKVTIFPKWQTVTYNRWMENMHDWPISRQVVWGIRIPVWYNADETDLHLTFLNSKGETVEGNTSELLNTYSLEEIKAGLQTVLAPIDAKPVVSSTEPSERFIQETDTFDTWFSSGHWPLATLRYPDSEDFKYFYPTSVLETGWEIIRPWVSRMIMLGMYLTRSKENPNGISPFEHVYLHGLVRATDGKKMSKSLGNVINPDEYIEQYGVDALRMGLISGTANGRDFNFPKDKIIGYRNFGNKIWNMARFVLMMVERYKEDTGLEFTYIDGASKEGKKLLRDTDKKIIDGTKALAKQVEKDLAKYRFSDAGDAIYQFMWHEIADVYIEQIKTREEATDKALALSVFLKVFADCLKLLHPFMPFVTEAIWQELPDVVRKDSEGVVHDLADSSWPK
jgi:valyl-tRNA synthetase